MASIDQRPMADTPVTAQIVQRHDNRLGAVYHALHSFWTARNAAFRDLVQRPDSYSLLLFDQDVYNVVSNDEDSTPEQLLQILLEYNAGWGTEYRGALNQARALIETHWDGHR